MKFLECKLTIALGFGLVDIESGVARRTFRITIDGAMDVSLCNAVWTFAVGHAKTTVGRSVCP